MRAAGAHDHGAPQVASHANPDLPLATEDVRARMTLALHDPLPFEPKLALALDDDRASPTAKPCIVPGNALQLIDDDPAASRSHTPVKQQSRRSITGSPKPIRSCTGATLSSNGSWLASCTL